MLAPCRAGGQLAAAHDPPRHIYICFSCDDAVFVMIAEEGKDKYLSHLSFN
jgi:hypothetical protein